MRNIADKDVLYYVYDKEQSHLYKPMDPLKWCEGNLLEALSHLREVVEEGPTEEAKEFLRKMLH